jgi:hypothetical protein
METGRRRSCLPGEAMQHWVNRCDPWFKLLALKFRERTRMYAKVSHRLGHAIFM